jgi:hypothetical protein
MATNSGRVGLLVLVLRLELGTAGCEEEWLVA